VNIQFGSAANMTTPASTGTGTDARTGVAVPAETDSKSTTSFVPVEETQQSERGRQEDARQGVEARQAIEQTRADRKDRNKNSREEEDVQQADRRQQKEVEQSQVDRQAEDRRAREAQEQRQLEAELQQIRKLAERDREVRAHEQAHQSVGGQYAGAASYTFERGPDGKNYAVGGEVSIDTGKIADDPQATLDKAETIRRAALAPAEPSSQDRRVAAQAVQMAVEARADIQQLAREEAELEAQESDEESVDNESEQERLEAEQKAQSQEKQEELVEDNTTADLQELNERLSRIQSQLLEASQLDDKINSKVNLLDVAT
jgi:hypothetical protein